MFRVKRLAALGLCGLIVIPMLGCGSEGVDVTGTVQFKGAPLPGAEIEFKPEGGENIYVAFSDDTGKFQVSQPAGGGIPPGSYNVTVLFWINKEGEFPPLTEEAEELKDQGVYFQVSGTSKHEVSAEKPTVSISLDPESVSRVPSDDDEGT